ncbi:hypothetical protein HETIRDRAFT_169178 [Heterobasidion irregulare TC 32-1]|uniref:Homeobox domain-containing protein n=1 Tax=Heterobasidion irregulare (strain TC 32-1) TaxID=747525 RepID=W4K3L4_HETIT|nr:uncharacterized protein HETIRDRAFT_169178 [Heterobasidion irregulare TC 32-1]ETW80428.1 hypothetical protein HETIRDRAFT_169178 [Heterobasidion irregulare TC 32-1]
MSTPRDNTYYYPNSGRLQSKSPTRGDTQSGSSVPEQGLFSYVNSMYINSDLKSTDVAPSTYASHYTQQRHPQPYDGGYASYPYQAPSQQHQASQYSMYQQQPDPRYAAQQTYSTYPSRTSPPIPADHHRHIPSHAHQPVRDDRWQAQSTSYYPQPTSSPQTMTSHSTVRSPQAAYPTQYPQYQPVATSTYPTDPNASRMTAHGQPVASQHHHMQMGHPSVERTVSSRNVASLPYSRGPPVMSPIDYDTAESSAEPTIKKKRKRADPHQLKILNDVYARTAFPSTEERADLAKRLDMSARSVQIWFQNKRQSMRTGGRQGNSSTPTTTSIPPNPPLMPSPPHVYDTSPTLVSPHSMASSSGTHYSSRSPPPTISTRKSPSPPGGRSMDPRKWFSRGGY